MLVHPQYPRECPTAFPTISFAICDYLRLHLWFLHRTGELDLEITCHEGLQGSGPLSAADHVLQWGHTQVVEVEDWDGDGQGSESKEAVRPVGIKLESMRGPRCGRPRPSADPEAEVIALSPKTLMATNRFVCEICNKGFQRDQNLQLHRRGHNLPWKLRQRTSKEIKKRVYICPEQNCVHHDPSRALGDLTGIKKHFCRKHGEKKWKCDKCSKRYAVQSDWKAHSKTCGTREYRCDCGTLFSRRDSFITHRAFCDALAEESARVSGGHGQLPSAVNNPLVGLAQGAGGAGMSAMGTPSSPGRSSMGRLGGGPLDSQFNSSVFRSSFGSNAGPSGSFNSRPRLSLWLGHGPGTDKTVMQGAGNNHSVNPMDVASGFYTQSPKSMLGSSDYDDNTQGPKPLSALLPMTSSNSGSLYSNLFTSGSSPLPGINTAVSSSLQQSGISENYVVAGSTNWTDRSSAAARLSLSTSAGLTSSSSSGTNNINDGGSLGTVSSSIYSQPQGNSSAQMSATALLQKAAQMGATASNSSILRPYGVPGSNSTSSVGLGLSWQGTAQDQQRAGNNIVSNLSHSTPFMKGPMDHIEQGTGNNYQESQSFSSRSSENAGLQYLMNSLSGGGSGLISGGSLSNMQSSFGSNMGDSGNNFSGLMVPGNVPRGLSVKDNIVHGGQLQQPLRGSSQQMIQGAIGDTLLPGMGNPARNEEGGDGLTRDFLGVGGASTGMVGRTFSQREIANFTSLGSGMDISSLRDNLRSVGANGQSPGRSWDI
eukprot:Gb_01996 [translate_table: standard]